MTLRYTIKGEWAGWELFESIEEMRQCFSYLSDEEFEAKKYEIDIDKPEYIMRNIPDEFKSVLSMRAYDSGHSAGEDEVISILRGLVSDFEKPIKDYTERLISNLNI